MKIDAIYTERLTLRFPEAGDLAAYTQYLASERSRHVGGPFDSVQAFNKFASMIGHWTLRGFGRFIFADTATNRPIGHVGGLQLNVHELPEITWTIWDGADEGAGYAFEAATAYKIYAARELGIGFMIARIMPDNMPSRHLAERLGGVFNAQTPAPSWYPGALTYDFEMQDLV